MRVHNFTPDVDCCCDYYNEQAGGGIPYYAGATMQHGGGIGDVLKGLFRKAVPIMKAVGKKVLPKIARAGLRAVEDVVTHNKPPGQAILDSAKEEITKGIKGERKRKAPRKKLMAVKKPKENY